MKAIENKFHNAGQGVLVASSFGSAAKCIQGNTLYGALSLEFNKTNNFESVCKRLKPSKKLQKKLKGHTLILIDEFSVISPSFLNLIDKAMRIKLEINHSFASFSVILIGDFSQMLPVASHTLWSETSKLDRFSKEGQDIYRNEFKTVFVLKEVMRQAEDSTFTNLLYNIRTKNVKEPDVALIRSRCRENLSEEEQIKFKDSLRIFCTNSQIRDFNLKKLVSLGNPIIMLIPVQQPQFPKLQDISPSIPISLNAPILLQRNFHLGLSLSTNTLGIVRGIIFNPDDINDKFPVLLMVEFEGVDIPGFQGLVPIPYSLDYEFDKASRTNIRVKQFNITLGFSLSVHKSQGMQTDSVCLDLGDEEQFVSQAYVQLSRCNSLLNILIENNFPDDRFTSRRFFSGYQELLKEYARLNIYQDILSHVSCPKKIKLDLD